MFTNDWTSGRQRVWTRQWRHGAAPRWTTWRASQRTGPTRTTTRTRMMVSGRQTLVSPLPVFTPEGTIGLPSSRPSVCLSVRPSVSLSVRLKSGSFDILKTIKARLMKLGMCIGSNVYNMHTQHLSRYLEGQGHSMTLKQNRVRPIFLLFEVGF